MEWIMIHYTNWLYSPVNYMINNAHTAFPYLLTASNNLLMLSLIYPVLYLFYANKTNDTDDFASCLVVLGFRSSHNWKCCLALIEI